MMQGANFDEAKLKLSSLQVADYIDQFRLEPDRWEHAFSEAYETRKNSTIIMVKNGTMPQNRLREGWQYYARKGLVAAFIGGAIICVTMPEQVMAGCQKIVEVIQTVYREYTQLDYYSNADSSTEWKPLQVTYLPQNMSKVPEESVEKRNATYSVYKTDEKYFIIEQIMITEQSNRTENIDTENAIINRINRQGDTVLLISKNGMIQFVWMHGTYEIRGKTTLAEEELIRVLNGIVL